MTAAVEPVVPEPRLLAAPERLSPFPRWRFRTARVVGVGTMVLGAVYLWWRLTSLVGPTWVAVVLWVGELGAYCSIAASVAALWQRRVRVGPPVGPRGSLDVLVPVCGEPLEMVEETLTAALDIAYPHQVWLLNDGRIAGKENWREIEALARRKGVRSLTRTEGRRGKAANLNHGLHHSTGEFVGVIDADHRVEPLFAHETLGYFEDPNVALVTTPQVFAVEGEDVLNNLEPFFYGHCQPAKDASNAAFSCGNGVVYRRAALAEVGGFSEWNLVEDLHTSYLLHAAGFESVYHPAALTVGTAPTTAAGLAKQRLTWATDSLRLLFFDNPLRKRGLTVAQRLHYLYTSTSYLSGILLLTFWIAPLVYLLLDLSTIRGSETGWAYAVIAGPYYLFVFGWLATFLGVRNTFRATAQRTFLAPIFLLAAVKAAFARRHARTVTEKVVEPQFSVLLLPMIGIAALSVVALTYLAVGADRRMTAVLASAAATTLLMSGILTAVTSDQRKRQRLRVTAVAGTLGVVVVFLLRAY
jgi:cellulose synthase/poly-beta-1,6-N-acetylglucosamine synthase-like glycosyltransferase